jgi:hypothetical protein
MNISEFEKDLTLHSLIKSENYLPSSNGVICKFIITRFVDLLYNGNSHLFFLNS